MPIKIPILESARPRIEKTKDQKLDAFCKVQQMHDKNFPSKNELIDQVIGDFIRKTVDPFFAKLKFR